MPETETFVLPRGLLRALHTYLSQSSLPYAEVNQFIKALEACRQVTPEAGESAPEERVDA